MLTDMHQQKPTGNERLSPLFYVDDCWCLSMELAQNRHSGRNAVDPLHLSFVLR